VSGGLPVFGRCFVARDGVARNGVLAAAVSSIGLSSIDAAFAVAGASYYNRATFTSEQLRDDAQEI